MRKDFAAFLSTYLPSHLAAYWQGAELERIDVYPAKRAWCLYIILNHPLPAELVQTTGQQLTERLDALETIEIVPSLSKWQEGLNWIIDKHKEELVSSFFDPHGLREGLTWTIGEQRLDLVFHDGEKYRQAIAADICTNLSAWFRQEYALRVVVRALNAGFSPSPSLEEAFTQQKSIQLPGIPVPPKGRKGKKKAGKGSLDQYEITMVRDLQEGQRDVVAQGYIWDKELAPIKGGRFVASYYLTDFTDTIIVKSFLDGQGEDQIKVRQWVRVKGNIRYDDISREIALFMDTFDPVPPHNRPDLAEKKRVELHAHTKMSAMDGLTEIEDLIEQAASWGHPAIAITDHGCTQAFPRAFAAAEKHTIKILYGVEGYLVEADKKEKPYHIILLARTQAGLKNLYRLVSSSYLEHFYRHPKIPRALLQSCREGILIGSACEAGELYRALLNGVEEDRLEEIALFYDYLEIQPTGNNEFLIREGRIRDEQELQELNRRIVELGKKLGKPVVATGDVHFLEPHHQSFRKIIQAGQGYDESESQAPLYFRSTDEMMDEFAYLGADAHLVVVDAPQQIADMIENLRPVPEGFFPPQIDGAAEEIVALTYQKAHQLYGKTLPAVVEERISRELNSITTHGFSVLYLIAHKLVRKSNQDGYMVGSRGSVGSSLVAHLCGITEVNPLSPHYRCPACGYSQFVEEGPAGCGPDLEERDCPACGHLLAQEGFDIPFETFLGFGGNKVPDIDLNFSGDYQSRAHQYVEELFGSENVFRAGTISTIAEKTAYGFVKKYSEQYQVPIKNSELRRLVNGITGVRRTTGQHPGGLIVVPRDRDILEFTPLQHPADKKDSGVVTTHFEYHAIGEQLVKLDILGHDDPTVLKELEDLTGVCATDISLSEKETMRIFSGVEPLGVTAEEIGSTVGTYGIPEFGTRFVRQMLEATRPTTFAELVRISGLSHGTDVWLHNAQDLIQQGTASLKEVICTRDDIMLYLIGQGIDKKSAFDIMELVRKGKGIKPGQVSLMEEQQVPSWYIDSCQKIKYMFPKAHAVAYVMMAFRIAFFKVYYPREFYASFFSIRAEDFDAETILGGYDAVRHRLEEINRQGQKASQKDKKLVPILELAQEMYARGFSFYPVDLYKSHASKFLVHGNGLLLPFSSLPNVGLAAAEGISEAREEGHFISVEDFRQRSHLNKTALEVLKQHGCFAGLPESTQASLFG